MNNDSTLPYEVRGPTFSATPLAYVNGTIVSLARTGVTAATQGLNYGTGVFEGIRAYWDESTEALNIIRLREHWERFAASCRFLRLEVEASIEQLIGATVKLLQENRYRGDVYIRPIAHKLQLLPGAGFGVKLRGISTALAIYVLPMSSSGTPTAIRCAVSSWRRIPDNSVPACAKITGSYVNIALAVDEVQDAGYDDAILLNVRGTVAEASTSNIFVVRKGQLNTPSVSAGILEGITRRCIAEIAGRDGIPFIERDIARSELYSADEVFLTGTGCEVVPVVEIDGRAIGYGSIGPLTATLVQKYHAAVRGDDTTYAHWITPVFIPR